jgi:hypothetical protein
MTPDRQPEQMQPVQRIGAFLRRIAQSRARAGAVAALIAGIAGDLAARQRQPNAHGGKGHSSHHEKNHGSHQGASDNRSQQEAHHQQHGGHAGTHHAAAGGGSGHGHHGHGAGHGQASGEARQTPTPTPTPTGHGGGGGGGGGAGKGHGNAGSAFFDSPLATKARRRAHDFAQHNGNAGSQTNGISVSTGPDGTTIQTHNITYHAAPTPLPTPFPRLTLPGQEVAPNGGGISATPTPSKHLPADTSGGNSSTGFMS